MMKTYKELQAEVHAALKAQNDNELERALEAAHEYRINHPDEFVFDDDDDLDDEVLDEDEDYEEETYPEVDDEGYTYDIYGNPHYVGHKSWEQRAWEDSGMTMADFI